MSKKTVLILCTHNSARSQLAEGLLNVFHGTKFTAFSAGTKPSRVNPFAVKALAEIGIDISAHTSKHVKDFVGKPLDIVITVCDNAKEECPYFPGVKTVIHHSFKDPSAETGNDAAKLAVFRKTRDEIKEWLEKDFVNKYR
ncbi:MAG: arsenate reductase ArsC [Candidatus Firestonebacteria bacterium]